jgi:hypothetical protein
MKGMIQPGLAAVLAGVLTLAPLASQAQQTANPPADTQQQTTAPADQTNQQAQPTQSPSGTQVNPAQGPLEPVPTTPDQNQLPETPQAQQPGATQPAQQAPATPAPQKQNQSEPLGTAAAPGANTVGGGASKPAGTAIAPAKQKQYRSLLLKLGLIAAGGAALGTVYALSRGTSSTPPNSGR